MQMTLKFFSVYPSDHDADITFLHNALQHISSSMTANLLTLKTSKKPIVFFWTQAIAI